MFLNWSSGKPFYELLPYSGSVINSCDVSLARLAPLVPVTAEIVHYVSVAEGRRKLDGGHDEMVDSNKKMVVDLSTELIGV